MNYQSSLTHQNPLPLAQALRIFLFLLTFLALYPYFFAYAATPRQEFVKTANYFLHAGPQINPDTYSQLSSYDVLILAMEAQEYNKDFFEYARKKNPHIIILAYVPSRSINVLNIEDGAQIRKHLKDGIRNDWYLKSHTGDVVQAWPGTIPINVSTDWNTYLPAFVNTTLMSTGLWDGIFYDEVQDDMTYLNHGDIDLDQDGTIDSREQAQEIWKQGNKKLFETTKKLIGQDRYIVINGSSFQEYAPFLSGRMFENFPNISDSHGRWADMMSQYLSLQLCNKTYSVCIINANTGNNNIQNLQHMRFDLVSTLLGDGYYSFDFGDKDHGQLWKYDEYGIFLGKAKSDIETFNKQPISSIGQTVFRREFQNGIALLNATAEKKTLIFDEEFEKLHGTQDSNQNDGSITSSLTLQGNDGIILLRPLEKIQNAPFTNGSFVKIFNENGDATRNGFFAYDKDARGSAIIAYHDLYHTGTPEKIVADKGEIRIFDENNTVIMKTKPFGPDYTDAYEIAFVDSNGDGIDEILVAQDFGTQEQVQIKQKKQAKKQPFSFRTIIKKFAQEIKKIPQSRNKKQGSQIKIIKADTGEVIKTLTPFGNTYHSPLHISSSPHSSNTSLFVVGTGVGSKPEVRIFTTDGKQVGKPLIPYSTNFLGGVSVTLGDLEGDGTLSIITGPGPQGGPHIRVFNLETRKLTSEFFAYQHTNTSGVHVLATDIDGDGKDDILALTTHVFTTASE